MLIEMLTKIYYNRKWTTLIKEMNMLIKVRNSFQNLKDLIQKNQITIINATVTIILIGTVMFVLLSRSNNLQQRTIEESLINLADVTSDEIQAQILSNIDSARSVSQILAGYRNIDSSNRRSFIDNTIREALSSTRTMTRLYTVWRPNELDGMDALFANTEGSDETGNYIKGFTRERGWIEQKAFGEYRYTLDLEYTNYFGYLIEKLSDLYPMTLPGAGLNEWIDTWVIDLWIPITNDEQVVGILGATINLQSFQIMAETRKPFETGHIIVCANDGTIIGYPHHELRGRNILSFNILTMLDDFIDENEVIGDGTPVSPQYRLWDRVFTSFSDSKSRLFRSKAMMAVLTPIRTTSTMAMSFTYGGVHTPPWILVTQVPMETIMAPIYDMLRFSIIFIIGAGFLIVFILLSTSRTVTQRAKNLQRSLEHASTMQDNLKYGLFLMDDKFVIQGAYSKALEKILAVPGLQGRSFIDLLSASLKEHEREGFADYLNMIFKRSFDEQMLESINPISMFTYYIAGSDEKKSLRTTFKLAGGRGVNLILGTMEDITAEKELQQQLMEAESQREKEMRSLFEVLQLNPRVLSDFIEEAEYEFAAINDLLKRKEHISREVMFELYQSVHAVKSNALILDLESFSARLHDLENSIKLLQEKNEGIVPFDDLLGLVLEIDEALKEKDELKAAISKIENFRKMHGESGNQEIYVLVETLTQVCRKASVSLNKKARLVIEGIDEVVIDRGPRRVIKEVLTQLVRNSVYHGIETPAERVPLGKDPEGELRLSIKYRDNQIVIKFTDNGRGIDFNQVRKRVVENNMARNPSDANDKNYLLKAIFSPGFSTLQNADLHGGRGVGLSLVKDRIKDLLGNITVTTAPGRGTTFTISIPMELPVFASKDP